MVTVNGAGWDDGCLFVNRHAQVGSVWQTWSLLQTEPAKAPPRTVQSAVVVHWTRLESTLMLQPREETTSAKTVTAQPTIRSERKTKLQLGLIGPEEGLGRPNAARGREQVKSR